MKLDFKQPLISLDGQFVQFEDKDLTLGKACMLAVLNEDPNDRPDGAEKFKRWGIAKKIKNGEELKAEDLALIKEQVGKLWLAGVVGPIFEIFEKLKI